MKIIKDKLKELQQVRRHNYCLMSNVVPDEAFLLSSDEFVEQWVSDGLEVYNSCLKLNMIENEAKIKLLEEMIG